MIAAGWYIITLVIVLQLRCENATADAAVKNKNDNQQL